MGDNTGGGRGYTAADQVPVCWIWTSTGLPCVYMYAIVHHMYTQLRLATGRQERNYCVSRGVPTYVPLKGRYPPTKLNSVQKTTILIFNAVKASLLLQIMKSWSSYWFMSCTLKMQAACFPKQWYPLPKTIDSSINIHHHENLWSHTGKKCKVQKTVSHVCYQGFKFWARHFLWPQRQPTWRPTSLLSGYRGSPLSNTKV